MNPQDLNKIFVIFQRLHVHSKKEYSGPVLVWLSVKRLSKPMAVEYGENQNPTREALFISQYRNSKYLTWCVAKENFAFNAGICLFDALI